jgi:hypothetical protein
MGVPAVAEEKFYRTPSYVRRSVGEYYKRHREELLEVQRLLKRRLATDEEFQEKRRRYLRECQEEVRRMQREKAGAHTSMWIQLAEN